MGSIVFKSRIVTLPNLPKALAGYRILHLSDIHLGRGPDRTAEILNGVSGQTADALVITGDLAHDEKHPELVPKFLTELGRTAKVRDGIFGVFGNHDLYLQKSDFCSSPLQWLDNSSVRIHRDGAAISFIGLNQKEWYRTGYLEALEQVEADDFKIVLAHYPSTSYLLNGLANLVITGHTHAGQIRLPGLPFKTNDDISWREGCGVSRIGRTTLVVSAGIGYSGPFNFRLFAPSEIGMIQLG